MATNFTFLAIPLLFLISKGFIVRHKVLPQCTQRRTKPHTLQCDLQLTAQFPLLYCQRLLISMRLITCQPITRTTLIILLPTHLHWPGFYTLSLLSQSSNANCKKFPENPHCETWVSLLAGSMMMGFEPTTFYAHTIVIVHRLNLSSINLIYYEHSALPLSYIIQSMQSTSMMN